MLYSRKVWQIDSVQAFGVRKFGELIVSTTLYGFSLVNHNLPNPPNFPPPPNLSTIWYVPKQCIQPQTPM